VQANGRARSTRTGRTQCPVGREFSLALRPSAAETHAKRDFRLALALAWAGTPEFGGVSGCIVRERCRQNPRKARAQERARVTRTGPPRRARTPLRSAQASVQPWSL